MWRGASARACCGIGRRVRWIVPGWTLHKVATQYAEIDSAGDLADDSAGGAGHGRGNEYALVAALQKQQRRYRGSKPLREAEHENSARRVIEAGRRLGSVSGLSFLVALLGPLHRDRVVARLRPAGGERGAAPTRPEPALGAGRPGTLSVDLNRAATASKIKSSSRKKTEALKGPPSESCTHFEIFSSKGMV